MELCNSDEIFLKAKEYAAYIPIVNGRGQMMPLVFTNDGAKRLHEQAMKVLDMAIGLATEVEHKENDSLRSAIYAHLDYLQQRYADGWKLEEDGWCYKDFTSSTDLIEMLGFLRYMGVHYVRQDRNSLDEAIHLRVTPQDMGIIFNPSACDGRQR